MKKTILAVLAAALLGACSTQSMTARDRELLAADVRDAVTLAATFAPEGAQPYVEAVDVALTAFLANPDGFDWPAAFGAVRAQEPALRQALSDAGWEPERIDTAILAVNVLLRRVEAQVAPQPPPAEAIAPVGLERVGAPDQDSIDQVHVHTECCCRCAENPPVDPPPPLVGSLDLSEPRVVTNLNDKLYRGECWMYDRDGTGRWNWGDGAMAIVELDGELWYVLANRRGGNAEPGGMVSLKRYDGNPYEGWDVSLEFYTPKTLPGLPNTPTEWNWDTFQIAQNPLTKLVTVWGGGKRGWRFGSTVTGEENTPAIVRATSMSPSAQPDAWRRYGNDLVRKPTFAWEEPWSNGQDWFGGSAESSSTIWGDHLYLVGEAKRYAGKPDAFGQTQRSDLWLQRIALDKLDESNPEDWEMRSTPFFSPMTWTDKYGDTDRTAVPGTANMTLRSCFFILPDGSRHLLGINSIPNTGRGKVNGETAIYHWFQHGNPDDWTAWGESWEIDDAAPLIRREDMPGYVDVNQANRINSPWAFVDTHQTPHILYVGHWGNPVGEQNKQGTRLYLREMALPLAR